MSVTENPCPLCGSETTYTPECPTYRSGSGTWMRCFPTCGNASSYSCMNLECDWEYLEGVSWGNPNWARHLPTNGVRPGWLGEETA